MTERLPVLLLGILLLLCATLAWIWTIPPEASSAGFTHPTYPTMQQAGDGAERFAPLRLPAIAWGSLSILFFVGLLLLGAGRHARRALPSVAIGTVIYLGVFLMLIRSYGSYARAPDETGFFLGFPTTTAWMLYGIWLAPFFFVVSYVFRFDSLVFTKEDERRFRQIVEEHSANTSEESR